MPYGIRDKDHTQSTERKNCVHIIDKWGETTLCGKFSAWKTANPDYSATDRSYYGSLELVNLDHGSGHNYCKTCARRYLGGEYSDGICRNCKRILQSEVDFDNGEIKTEVCKRCGYEHENGNIPYQDNNTLPGEDKYPYRKFNLNERLKRLKAD